MQNYATFKDLEDTSVFITGGGSGIGASITEGFLSQGAKVAFVQRSDCDEFLSKVSSQYKYKPLFIKCDITRTDDLKNAIAHASQVNGGINVLINNAANDTRHTLEEMTSAEWDKAININLKPHFFTAQAVAPMMKSHSVCCIITFSSHSYLTGTALLPPSFSSNA